MRRVGDLHAQLAALSANLKEHSKYGADGLVELEELLARSRLSDPSSDLVSRQLSVERATWFAPENLAEERQRRLQMLAARTDLQAPEEFRVFRREAPVAVPPLGAASPPWAAGAAIDRTMGPFTSLDGRQFWFDFFRIVRLVPLYFAGNSQPAVLFHVHQLRLRPGDPFPIPRIIDFLRRRYELAGSSIWIRANLLAAAAPVGTYVGLRIASGHITVSPPPADVGGKLTIPAGGTCAIELTFGASAPPMNAPGQAGDDASRATLDLPDRVSISLTPGQATVTPHGRTSWTLYGQQLEFTPQQGSTPTFEPALQSVLIPMTAAPQQVVVAGSRSPFATLAGEAPIVRAGWALPAATIDVANPTEASGSGGLAALTAAGLSLTWRGLQDGPAALNAPWISLAPGVIFITDAKASARYAHQHLRLWKDGDSKFRSELNLRYTDAFPLTYVVATNGNEVVLAGTNAEARLDRPVDVQGTPFPVRTLASSLLLTYNDTQQFAFFYEDNILTDSLAPGATWPVEPGEAISVAIRNALFTVTPVNSLLLFAELADEEMVKSGVVLLGFGLYALLPTLPDPYAANVTWLRREGRQGQRSRQAGLLLVGAVNWTKAAGDDDPDAVTTSFAFAPLGTQAQTIATWSSAAVQQSLNPRAGLAGELEQPGNDASALATTAFDPTFSRRRNDGAIWDRAFARFSQEQFALLDVSTNADQMGVGFAWFNPRSIDESDYIFYQVFKPQGGNVPEPPFPLQVRDLDLSAESRYVRAFTVPQISWEPLVNLTAAQKALDPPAGFNLYPDDGGPTRLFNDSVALVPIAPIPVTDFLVSDFKDRKPGFTGALFTLPFGLRAFAEFSRANEWPAPPPPAPPLTPARLEFNRPEYSGGSLKGGRQLRADAPEHPAPGESPIFKGSTVQLSNVLRADGVATGAGTLGESVGEVFNLEFFYAQPNPGYNVRGVPLTRIDFSGYGASIFSHWQSPNAAIAQTSQARFDVFVGRTGEEVIQIRSIVYPWAIRVVRTITMFRGSNSYVFRYDTGWQPESAGVYDFRWFPLKLQADNSLKPAEQPSPYEIHPGIVRGVFNVRNIKELTIPPKFTRTWNKQPGDPYLDQFDSIHFVDGTTDPKYLTDGVSLQPVSFDADVQIDSVISGAAAGRVPSKGMLGYVQLAPRGIPLPRHLFAELLMEQFGAIGGPVDCVVNIAESGQQLRVSRVDVNVSQNGPQPIFVSAARGSLVLPKDGAWTVVQHTHGSGEVAPIDPQSAVPLIRRGLLNSKSQTTDATAGDLLRIANPMDVVQPPGPNTRNYALLHSTVTQKALFRRPSFQIGITHLLGDAPDFADAYRIINSPGIFPNVKDALPLALGAFTVKILSDGYRLLDEANPAQVFEQKPLPEGPLYLINEESIKLYVEYAKKDKKGQKTSDGFLNYGFDSSAAAVGQKWLSKLNDIGMVVDLGSIKRLMIIKGALDAEKGADPGFRKPELEFSEDLKPVIDMLQILLTLNGGDYKDAIAKGLEIAMSNSADSWNYAFHARQEIPLVRFPPPLLDSPNTPLRLEAHLAIGVYFNEAMQIPGSPSS